MTVGSEDDPSSDRPAGDEGSDDEPTLLSLSWHTPVACVAGIS
jgi:hypothetical protein